MQTGREPAETRVLVMASDEIVALDVCETLADAGFAADEARTGLDAVLRALMRPYDLLIVDCAGSGVSFDARQTANVFDDILRLPVVFASAADPACLPAPGNFPSALLPKPFTRQELLQAVEQALGVPAPTAADLENPNRRSSAPALIHR